MTTPEADRLLGTIRKILERRGCCCDGCATGTGCDCDGWFPDDDADDRCIVCELKEEMESAP